MAEILMKGNDVFYNEAQVINRDLSVAVLRHFFPILEKERAEASASKGGVKGGGGRGKKGKKDMEGASTSKEGEKEPTGWKVGMGSRCMGHSSHEPQCAMYDVAARVIPAMCLTPSALHHAANIGICSNSLPHSLP